MVMAQALYRYLAGRPRATEIHVLAPPWSLPLIERMPEVARGVPIDVGHGRLGLSRRLAVARSLREERYDRAIVLPRSLKASLVPFLARIPRRTGFRGEARYGLINDMRPFDPAVLNQTVLRFLALGLEAPAAPLPEFPLPRLKVDTAARDAVSTRLGVDAARPAVALMPGAEYGPAKQWPAERFAALARRLDAAGFAVWLLGSAKERPLAAAIVSASRVASARNLCGETTLPEVVDLLAGATAAVTNDSGLMHVAAAVGIHVVAIYGSSTPDFTPPLTSRRSVLYERLSCSPCFERTCPLGHLNCLRNIDTDTVFAALVGAISEPRRGDAHV
jgi:heptosyltransferase-2